MDADLDTLATALYVRTDDLLKLYPEQVPYRPQVGIAPQISDAEIITLSVMQALLGYSSQARCCGTPPRISSTCSPTCLSSPATTSGSGSWPGR